MTRTRTRGVPLLAFALSVLLSSAASATLVGPEYPAPGGNSFSTTGGPSSNDPGGLDGHYTGFDAGAFTALYWGPQWGNVDTGPAAGLDGILNDLAFLSITGTKAVWQGTTGYTNGGNPADPATCVSCDIRLEIDISGLGANPWVLEASVVDLTSLAAGIGAVVDNSSGLDFDANFQFLAKLDTDSDGDFGDEVFAAINPIPQAGGGLTVSSFSGAFYSVPEPSLAILLGLGLVGLAARRSRSL